jgi:hypothetical protein
MQVIVLRRGFSLTWFWIYVMHVSAWEQVKSSGVPQIWASDHDGHYMQSLVHMFTAEILTTIAVMSTRSEIL